MYGTADSRRLRSIVCIGIPWAVNGHSFVVRVAVIVVTGWVAVTGTVIAGVAANRTVIALRIAGS